MNYVNPAECREQAREVVRGLIAKGYTLADAKAETMMGRTCADQDWSIAHGTICVPGLSRDEAHQFSFAQLAREIGIETRTENGQSIDDDGQILMVVEQ